MLRRPALQKPELPAVLSNLLVPMEVVEAEPTNIAAQVATSAVTTLLMPKLNHCRASICCASTRSGAICLAPCIIDAKTSHAGKVPDCREPATVESVGLYSLV